MSLLRPILMIAVVLVACLLSNRYAEHHQASNDDAFVALYKHLQPALLVAPVAHGDEHGDGQHATAEPLLKVPLPAFLALFDYDEDKATGTHLALYNLQIFQIAAVLLVLIAFSGVAQHMQRGGGDALTRFFSGGCLYIRDEMIRPNMKREHADKLLPLFYSLFFFILFMNLMGLVPGSATPTACIFVTAALAVITLGMMVLGGMFVQGPIAFWKNLVPHVPLWLWPLLFVVELIGVTVKPFALTIRLFANMTGGHMVVLSFMGLIFYFAGTQLSSMGYAIAPVAIVFAAFIMIIEAFVAFVQAYVFTILSAIFVGASLHPEH
ncbi:MAG: F0F1 ATP synthase subunit A [Planctomycetota bacterium]